MWINIQDELPPDKKVVKTKVDDGNTVTNEQELLRNGRRWYFPDWSMYVYYTPTHWWKENN